MKRGVKGIKWVNGRCVNIQHHIFHSHLTHCHLPNIATFEKYPQQEQGTPNENLPPVHY
jgi:hypothetical protein